MADKVDRIRGSINVPLDQDGLKEAHKVGKAFAAAGGIDLIVCSNLHRAVQTARIIKHYNSEAKGPVKSPSLQPMHLGSYEGQPTKDVMAQINALWDHPDRKAPGKAPQGTEAGESTNKFKDRAGNAFLRLIDYVDTENPDAKVVVVTHLRDIILAKALAEADWVVGDIKVESMKATPSEKPGSVFYVDYDNNRIVDSPRLTRAGLYLVRHGSTEFNGDQTKGAQS